MAISVEDMKADYDWCAAFSEAIGNGYRHYDEGEPHPIQNVTHVYASDPGENDGADWIAIVGWGGPEGAFAVMRAGCDYTGWDCRASGKIEFYATLREAVGKLTLTREEQQRLAADLARLGDIVEWHE